MKLRSSLGLCALAIVLGSGCAEASDDADLASSSDAVTDARTFKNQMEQCEELADDEDNTTSAAGLERIGACYKRINDRAVPAIRAKLLGPMVARGAIEGLFADQRAKSIVLGDLLAARQSEPRAVPIMKAAMKGMMENYLSYGIRDFGLTSVMPDFTMGLQMAITNMNAVLQMCQDKLDQVQESPNNIENQTALHTCLREKVRARMTELHASAEIEAALAAYLGAAEKTCEVLASYPPHEVYMSKLGKVQCTLQLETQVDVVVLGTLQED